MQDVEGDQGWGRKLDDFSKLREMSLLETAMSPKPRPSAKVPRNDSSASMRTRTGDNLILMTKGRVKKLQNAKYAPREPA